MMRFAVTFELLRLLFKVEGTGSAGSEIIIIDFRIPDLLAIFPCQNKDFEEVEWKSS
jgi:hypothetical protein